MATSTINSDVRVNGALIATSISATQATITGAMIAPTADIPRSKQQQDTNQEYGIDLTQLRVHDAVATLLPGTAAADDLGLDSGTFGTEALHVTAGDLKAAGATTRRCRFAYRLPLEYDDGQTVQIRITAKMETTVADTSCTVDVEAYEISGDLTVGSDLVTTAATSMNSLTSADYDFVVTATSLASGDLLDVRVSIACNDAATATVVEPVISGIAVTCDVRG